MPQAQAAGVERSDKTDTARSTSPEPAMAKNIAEIVLPGMLENELPFAIDDYFFAILEMRRHGAVGRGDYVGVD